jgi:nicotinate-nucleotide adenylyltransferase
MKTGVFGGSFDPVHNGHLILAQQLLEAAGLDKVVFVPAYVSPFKQGERPIDGKARLELLKLAVRGHKAFEISDCELVKEEPSYTIETLELLSAERKGEDLYFLLGTDAFMTLDTWYRGDELLRNYSFIVGRRKGFDDKALDLKKKEFEERFSARCEIYDIPELEISSSDVRARLADGRSADFILPEAVVDYIRVHGLYSEKNLLIEELREYARKHEKASRYKHTEGVVKMARELAVKYGADPDKAEIAAWFHDVCRDAGNLEHGAAAARKLEEEFGLRDREILEAIEWHTTGRPGMGLLTKVLKIADNLEESRDFPGVEELRAAINEDVDITLLTLMTHTKQYVEARGWDFATISDAVIEELETAVKGKETDG